MTEVKPSFPATDPAADRTEIRLGPLDLLPATPPAHTRAAWSDGLRRRLSCCRDADPQYDPAGAIYTTTCRNCGATI